MSRLRHPVVIAVGFLVVLVGAFGAVSGPCDDFTATGPAGSFDIVHENDTLVVTLIDGRIPADGTRSLDLTVRPPDHVGSGTRYPLVGPNGSAVEGGDRFTVENVTVAGRPLREGDVVRVVWRGYDLDERPFFCQPEERSRLSATLAKLVVGEG